MKPKLKKDYYSVPAGTIVKLVMRGTDGYNVINEKTGLVIAIMNAEQIAEYIQK
jgi:hypothetical protein